ncbi:MAG: hypothetical protein ACK5O7_03890 [Holosporales bacterium]
MSSWREVFRDAVKSVGRHKSLTHFALIGVILSLCGVPIIEAYAPDLIEFSSFVALVLVVLCPLPLIAAVVRDVHHIPDPRFSVMRRLVSVQELRLLGAMMGLLVALPVIWLLIVDMIGTVIGVLSFEEGGSLLLLFMQHGISPESMATGNMPIGIMLGIYGVLSLPLLFVTARLVPLMAMVVVRDIPLARAMVATWRQTQGCTLHLTLKIIVLGVIAFMAYALCMIAGALVNGFGDLMSELVAGLALALVMGVYMNAVAAALAARVLREKVQG